MSLQRRMCVCYAHNMYVTDTCVESLKLCPDKSTSVCKNAVLMCGQNSKTSSSVYIACVIDSNRRYAVLHHMTRPGSILEGFRYTYVKSNPARVRIWVISTVTAPNKHISCKSCSSRTGPSVTATMICLLYTSDAADE